MNDRFLIIFVSALLAVVLLVGGIFALVVGINNADAVATLDAVNVDAGCVRYLASYYKMLYLKALNTAGVGATDTAAFWQSEKEDGVSYGEDFAASFKEYLAALIASANLYLGVTTYSGDDRAAVDKAVKEILDYRAGGSVDRFNDMAKKYGFDYDDFKSAAALLYKSSRAMTLIYGDNGDKLKAYPDRCAEYLATYSHVSLLFVRTEELFLTDDEGNYVYNDDGSIALRDMTAEEKAVRTEIIDTLTAAIEAKNTGNDMQINEIMFENYLLQSDGDPSMYEKGYYFNSSASATAEFATAFPEVVDAALDMRVGEYRRVDCSIGVCFIYRYDVSVNAYADEENPFFSDFYPDAMTHLYYASLDTLSLEVSFSDSFNEIDPASIPKIEELYIRSFE